MPTYEYGCPKCGHEFEAFERKITNESTKKCPECGGRAQRLISGGAGLVFKGSGFYITDYKRAQSGDKADGNSGSEDGKSEKPAEKKGEQKAEKKKTDGD